MPGLILSIWYGLSHVIFTLWKHQVLEFSLPVQRTEERLKLKEANMEPRHLAPDTMFRPSMVSWPFQRQRLTSSRCGLKRAFGQKLRCDLESLFSFGSACISDGRAAPAFWAGPWPFMVRVYLDSLAICGFNCAWQVFPYGAGFVGTGETSSLSPEPGGAQWHCKIVRMSPWLNCTYTCL